MPWRLGGHLLPPPHNILSYTSSTARLYLSPVTSVLQGLCGYPSPMVELDILLFNEYNYLGRGKENLMGSVNIKIPDSFLISLNENEKELISQIKLYAALQFYKSHKLTLKQSADFAGLPLSQFILELNKHEIDVIDYDPADLLNELSLFKK